MSGSSWIPNKLPAVPQNMVDERRVLFASLSSIRSKSGCVDIGDMFHMGESVKKTESLKVTEIAILSVTEITEVKKI